MKKLYILLGLVSTGLLYNCSSDSASPEEEPTETVITYNANIKSIITANCYPCHNSPTTNAAPFSMTTFAETVNAVNTRPLRAAINDPINPMPEAGLMSQENRDLIGKWIDQGLKEK